MDKDQLETKFRRGGTVPTHREPMGDYDLYISEGYSKPPHLQAQSIGIVEPGDFPLGMYLTIWWLGQGEKLFAGQPIAFDALKTSQPTRLAEARRTAQKFMKTFQKVRRERGVTN